MRVYPMFCAAILAAMLPAAAMADDPHDPAMRDPAARAADHEAIRRLNLQESAMVRERDARYAEGWHASRRAYAEGDGDYRARSRDHELAMADYSRNRAQYEHDMAEWRRAVAACRAGDYAACQ